MAIPAGYKLIFEDNFDGTTLDTNKWYRYGDPNNVVISNSNVIIGPASGGIRGCKLDANWANCIEQAKFKFKYGYIEIRAKLAGSGTGAGANKGFCSQLWLYKVPPTNVPGQEINITETASGPMDNTNSLYGINKMNSSMHCPNQATSRTKTKNTGKDLSADYHLFAAEWTQTRVTYFFDGVEVNRFTSTDGICIPEGYMQIVIGLCRKNDVTKPNECWPTTEKASGTAKIYIDYVRVYQKENQRLDKITLSPSSISIKINQTQQLSAQCEGI